MVDLWLNRYAGFVGNLYVASIKIPTLVTSSLSSREKSKCAPALPRCSVFLLLLPLLKELTWKPLCGDFLPGSWTRGCFSLPLSANTDPLHSPVLVLV